MANLNDKYTPIGQIANVDESNYLIADFRDILAPKGVQGYDSTISQLWKCGRAIEQAVADGYTDRVSPIHTYYLEAMRWIKGQAATTSWIGIQPLDLNSSETNFRQQLDQFSQSWMPSFLTEFFNRPVPANYYFLDEKIQAQPMSQSQAKALEERAGELASELKDLSDKEQKRIRQVAALASWQEYFDSLIENPYEGKK